MRREGPWTCQALLRPSRLRELRAARRRERWDAERLARYRDERLADLLTFAAAHVPFYRERLPRGAVAPAEAAAVLSSLPPVDKRSLIDAPAAFRADVDDGRRIASSTGGSTGTVLRFDLDRRANAVRYAADARGREWAGWRGGETIAMLWGHHGDLAGLARGRRRLANALLHRLLMLDATDLGEERVARYLAAIRESGATLLIGYASALHYVARAMLDGGLAGPRLRGVLSTAESLGAAERAAVERAFACPVLDRYGSREMGVIAQQCERGGGLHMAADCVQLELIAPDGRPCRAGELGEIVVTDLHNRAMPFLRYRTGDLAVAADGACACGRTLPLLARVEGRLSDVLVGRNGRVTSCPGPVFWTEGVTGVRQLQLYQPDLATIEARVVPTEAWDDESARRLAARVRTVLGDVRVEVTLCQEIPVPPSGKFRFSISEVSPFTAARP